jgi:hypothetical protein
VPQNVQVTLVLLIIALVVGGVVVAARRLAATGGAEIVVRCREGHLFTTTWIPGVSVKAVRLGPIRYQRCPVGDHLTFVTPVPPSRLTDAQRQAAARYHDSTLP